MSGWDAARFGWLLACTLVASVTDLRERRIPNWLVILCAAATPIWVVVGVASAASALVGGALLGGLLLVPALIGRVGMGDVKLVAAVGLGIGLSGAGAVLIGVALGQLLATGFTRLLRSRAATLERGGWPLAPCILLGVAVAAAGVR